MITTPFSFPQCWSLQPSAILCLAVSSFLRTFSSVSQICPWTFAVSEISDKKATMKDFTRLVTGPCHQLVTWPSHCVTFLTWPTNRNTSRLPNIKGVEPLARKPIFRPVFFNFKRKYQRITLALQTRLHSHHFFYREESWSHMTTRITKNTRTIACIQIVWPVFLTKNGFYGITILQGFVW